MSRIYRLNALMESMHRKPKVTVIPLGVIDSDAELYNQEKEFAAKHGVFLPKVLFWYPDAAGATRDVSERYLTDGFAHLSFLRAEVDPLEYLASLAKKNSRPRARKNPAYQLKWYEKGKDAKKLGYFASTLAAKAAANQEASNREAHISNWVTPFLADTVSTAANVISNRGGFLGWFLVQEADSLEYLADTLNPAKKNPKAMCRKARRNPVYRLECWNLNAWEGTLPVTTKIGIFETPEEASTVVRRLAGDKGAAPHPCLWAPTVEGIWHHQQWANGRGGDDEFLSCDVRELSGSGWGYSIGVFRLVPIPDIEYLASLKIKS